MAVNRVLMGATNNAEVFLLGAIVGAGRVALFAAARRFIIVANAIFIAFGTIFSPMVSDLNAAEQHDHLARAVLPSGSIGELAGLVLLELAGRARRRTPTAATDDKPVAANATTGGDV